MVAKMVENILNICHNSPIYEPICLKFEGYIKNIFLKNIKIKINQNGGQDGGQDCAQNFDWL